MDTITLIFTIIGALATAVSLMRLVNWLEGTR
jgi:hypothetical protein